MLPPGVATVGSVRLTNPLRFLLLASPWDAGNEIAGVLEILRLPSAGPKTQEVCLAFLEAVCELVADFHRRRQLGNYRLWSADLKRIQDFAQQVHRSLDLKETAFTVANEGRRLIGCDRVSVLVRRGTRCRLVAVSGVATIHRRATRTAPWSVWRQGCSLRRNRYGTPRERLNGHRSSNDCWTRISTNLTPADWRSCRSACRHSKRRRTHLRRLVCWSWNGSPTRWMSPCVGTRRR